MSEASEKVLGIKQLPLFPLPLVLIPNEHLPLHIFEPRYRQMLNDIELRRNIFGVTYLDIEHGSADRPAIGSVGCAAELKEKNMLPDGRSNIVTIGVIRYRLIEYLDLGLPYLCGEVEFFEDEKEDESTLAPLADEVAVLFERVARAAFELGGSRGTFPEIPHTEPEPLSFLVTAAFNLDNETKYELVETTSTSERLTKLRSLLLNAVDKVESDAGIKKAARTNGHSKKNIGM